MQYLSGARVLLEVKAM